MTRDWYSRVTIGEKRVIFALGPDKRQAEALDLNLRGRLRSGQSVAEVRAFIARELGRDFQAPRPLARTTPPHDSAGRAWASLGEILKCFDAHTFEARTETTYRYTICLLNLVENTLRYRDAQPPVCRSGQRVSMRDYAHILSLPVSILDAKLVVDFKSARLAHSRSENKDELSAKISTNSELRQARCVFSLEAMILYKDAGLNLPDLLPFLHAPRFKKARRALQAPPESLVQGLHAALRNLTHDEALFLAIALALHAGLRKGEILNARREWLQTTTGPSIVLRYGHGFKPKNGEERTVPIPAWLYTRLHARADGYLIAADAGERTKVLGRAVDWLRAHGFAAFGKPMHAVRGLYAGYLLTRHSFLVVRERLGHRDLRTTLDFYADQPFCEEIAALWEVALPAVASLPPGQTTEAPAAGQENSRDML